MPKRHAIQVLRRAGHPLEEIAHLVAVGKRSVQRIVAEPGMTVLRLEPATGSARIGRRSKAEPYRARIVAWLAEEPGLLSVELALREPGEGGCIARLGREVGTDEFPDPRGHLQLPAYAILHGRLLFPSPLPAWSSRYRARFTR